MTESKQHAMTCAICVEVGSCSVRRELETEEAERSLPNGSRIKLISVANQEPLVGFQPYRPEV